MKSGPTSSDKGFVYVAWGREFIEEAQRSVQSLRRFCDYPVTLVTSDAVEPNQWFNDVIKVDLSHTYRDKIKMGLAPYSKTIFLDTDTCILGEIEQLFSLLDRFDIFYQPSAPSDHYQLSGVPMLAFEEPSAGLIGWRKNSSTERFFELWDDEYTLQEDSNGHGAWDQRSMRAALWRSEVSIATLSRDWQLYSFESAICMNKVRIVHGRGASAAQAIAASKDTIGPRLYMPRMGFTNLRGAPTDYFRLSFRAARMGLRRSLRLALHHTGIKPLPINSRSM